MCNKTFFYKWEQLIKYKKKPYYDEDKGISSIMWIQAYDYQQSQEKLYEIIPQELQSQFDCTVSYQQGTTISNQRVPQEDDKQYLPIIYKTLPLGYYEDFVHLLDNTFYGAKKDII